MIATKEWVKSLLSKLLKQNDIYSYTERRIGTWVDGKALYRKCYNWGYGPNKTIQTRTFSQIGIPDGCRITSLKLIIRWNSNSDNTFYNLLNNDTIRTVWSDSNSVSLNSGSNNESTNYYMLIVEYTKP